LSIGRTPAGSGRHKTIGRTPAGSGRHETIGRTPAGSGRHKTIGRTPAGSGRHKTIRRTHPRSRQGSLKTCAHRHAEGMLRAMVSRVSLLLAVSLCACASGAPAARGPAAPAKAPAAVSQPPPALPEHSLRRSAVRDAVAQGLGVFLQRIELDDRPVQVEGRFHGFRIAALRDADFWNGVDLRPGDVVTAINGLPIEHPEQAQTAFDSLQVASALRVSYDRDGQSRELVYTIVDDR
jgi:hypothetical protein